MFLRMKNRPTIIPLWMPLSVTLAVDGTAPRPNIAIESEHPNLDNSQTEDCDTFIRIDDESADSTMSETAESFPTTITIDTEQSCTYTVPDLKRIRCGTRSDCMEEDATDASNAVTVEWARA